MYPAGYKEPTAIQKKSIPHIIRKEHILATAQTGTGKTAAFVLPILSHLTTKKRKGRGPRILIISPTRELANSRVGEIINILGPLPLRFLVVK